MSNPTVTIELMRSQWKIGGKYYRALCIDGIRHGPDAGPWKVIQTFKVDAAELRKVAETALGPSQFDRTLDEALNSGDGTYRP